MTEIGVRRSSATGGTNAGSLGEKDEIHSTMSRKSRKHEAARALFRHGGDLDTENGGRCCRRSFVGSTFGPFTWLLLAKSLAITRPALPFPPSDRI
ncbi:hypothetical protein K0M31_004688 [Melipona bicolor]|uniref:Uncharacterized protein n=1 Tax=Melipona bicolor TaxID=60889 RepID=A0AA40FXA1_9HYME|nr:hypothetical protein K0M31_004688 [Melipona bicolor]